MTNFTWYDVSDATVGVLFGLAGVWGGYARRGLIGRWQADALEKQAQIKLAEADGEVKNKLKEADIRDGLEDTLGILQHELKRGITVRRDYGEVPPFAHCPGRLNQVFLNILVNAIQAIGKQGEITVTTRRKGNRAFIEITDTGCGIPAENLERIFDPGFTTKGVGVGTGLGLPICYQIVRDHDGEIRVASEAGKGTTFTIVLPMDLGDRNARERFLSQ